jgi:tRNA (guanosine-2'-O-)-methyltransferase
VSSWRAALALTALAPLAGCHPLTSGAARSGDSPGGLAGGYPTPEPPARPELPASVPEAPSIRSLDPCVPGNVEVCFNALDDNCNGAIDEGCGTPGGVVQFMIAWDGARADVDLNVTDPNGELIEAGRISQSGLIKGRDCPGRRQECGGVNLENVFLEGSKAPTRGTYRLGISLEKLNGEEPPIWVTLSSRLGAKHVAYEIRLNEAEEEQQLELSL